MKELLVRQRGEEHIWKQVAEGLGGKRVEKPAQTCKEQALLTKSQHGSCCLHLYFPHRAFGFVSQTFIENSKNWTLERAVAGALCALKLCTSLTGCGLVTSEPYVPD